MELFIDKPGKVKLDVTMIPGSGEFEICENGSLVASGRIQVAGDNELDAAYAADQVADEEDQSGMSDGVMLKLNSDDIYKELRLRGYEYGPTFQSLISADGNGWSRCY